MAKVLDTLFLILVLVAFAVQQPITIILSYALFALYIFKDRRRVAITLIHTLAFSVILLLLLLSVLNFKHGATSLFYLATLPLVVLSAHLFSSKPLDYIFSCLTNVFWLFVTAITFGLALHWDDPAPLGAIIPGSSTNGLPSYLIVLQIGLAITALMKNSRLPLMSAIATLIVAIFGLGRGSMVVAALTLILSILANLYILNSKFDRKIFSRILIPAVPIFGYYILNNYDNLASSVDIIIEGSKFSDGILDEHRGRIFKDYTTKIDAWSLLFGTDYAGTSIIKQYGGNPHNSFIRMHSFYGIFGLILIAFSLILILISKKNNTYKLITFILVLLSLIRAATEPIFFPSTLDFFYLLYIFVYLKYAPPFRNRLHKHA